ncbi:glycosyltransferase family 2 protein [Sporolactobacillus sp. KGMB 08714]|uniref:glycosyltransferase family 2 protein n=1 Tax=Sporolactobacillus sp. KGMB 08714 TaxID=3064704 RepID=UPI002FBDC571
MKNKKISVLINTFNEEKNIRNCLESVKWADEIIIVDMFSEDNTVKIASEYTNKIFYFKRMGFADPARQFALEKATNEWILVVDADELITQDLRKYLIKCIENDEYDALWIPRKNYFFGEEMTGTGWGPSQDKQMRFYKKKFMSYSDQIHKFVNLSSEARVSIIKDKNLNIIHFNYLSVEQFIHKLNKYTTIEAKQLKNTDKVSTFRIFLICIIEFLKRYFKRKGYKDGATGFSLSILMTSYRASSLLKHNYLIKYNSDNIEDKVRNIYSTIAKKAISGND